MTYRRTADKALYNFLDKKCIGRPCWAPGMYQHRSPLSCGGSRNTGSPDTPCCLNRAYRGCPSGPDGERKDKCPECNGTKTVEVRPAGHGYSDDLAEYEQCDVCRGAGELISQGVPTFDATLAKKRKAEGWRAA